MNHLWSLATQRPPWALFAALQSEDSQVTSEDCRKIAREIIHGHVNMLRGRTQSLRQYSRSEESWFRKKVKHELYCIVILSVGV